MKKNQETYKILKSYTEGKISKYDVMDELNLDNYIELGCLLEEYEINPHTDNKNSDTEELIDILKG